MSEKRLSICGESPDGQQQAGAASAPGRRPSALRVSRTKSHLPPLTAGRSKSHPSGVHVHRRLSGIFAAVALAQLSLGGVVARHAGCEVSSYSSSGQHEHANGPMDAQRADPRVMHEIAGLGDAPACDHSAQETCAGMASCTVALACVGSARFLVALRASRMNAALQSVMNPPATAGGSDFLFISE